MRVISRTVFPYDILQLGVLIKPSSRGLKFNSFNFCHRSTLRHSNGIMKNNSRHSSSDSISTYVVCGPSGSGKTTLLSMVTSHFNDCFKYCVSHTTRQPRLNEQEGKSYYFIDVDTFQKMVVNNEFAEYVQFSGNYYGTSRRELEAVKKSNRIPILDVDIRGVTTLKTVNFPAKYIFITTPTLEVLERNLKSRGSENEETLQKRLKHAKEDIEEAEKLKFDIIIVNSDLTVAFQQFKDFVQDVSFKLMVCFYKLIYFFQDVNKLEH